MLLLIDAGNTRIKWAVVPAGAGTAVLGQWTDSGSVAHGEVGQLVEAWRRYPVGRVLLSNVAGAAMQEELEQALAATLGLHPVPVDWFASVAELAGVRNGYRAPGQLGCDRFAAAIGARALFPGRALVVATCGTATTVDAVTAEGVFAGGMILPGLGLMAATLAKNTAQLPRVAADIEVSGPFADNTDAAIASGCIAAQAGAIERAAAAHARYSGQDVLCVLSGGAAALIAPHLGLPSQQIDNLVLVGLHQVVLTTC